MSVIYPTEQFFKNSDIKTAVKNSLDELSRTMEDYITQIAGPNTDNETKKKIVEDFFSEVENKKEDKSVSSN